MNMPKISRGFTLLEVLVTLIIMSIGFLGIAGLVVKTLQYNKGAYARSQATAAASDISDRMRANRTVALAGGYNLALAATPAGTTVPAAELVNWRTTLAATMPKGTGSISVLNGAAVVIVRWDDSRAAGTSKTEELRMETRL